MPTLLIGADVCPIEGNTPYLIQGDAQTLFRDLLPEFERADLVIANLECPLIDRKRPIPKTGPAFGESPACLNGLVAAGIDVLTLANNHILDHGAAGLERTLRACGEAGITTVGAGENLAAARRIVVREIGGVRVGLLAVAEHEFSIARASGWGASPLDLIDMVRNMEATAGEWDYLVVLLHGSHEFFAPTPRIQETCRFLVERGANAVLVQHPHVLGGYENYRSGHIVYGQGALLMDEAIYRDSKSFHEGFLVKLTLDRPEGQAPGAVRSRMELVPFLQSWPPPGGRKMTEPERAELESRLEVRSKAILNRAYLEAEWLRFCEARKDRYLAVLLGQNRVMAKLNVRGVLTRMLYGRDQLMRVRNCLLCETHREALETVFEEILGFGGRDRGGRDNGR